MYGANPKIDNVIICGLAMKEIMKGQRFLILQLLNHYLKEDWGLLLGLEHWKHTLNFTHCKGF